MQRTEITGTPSAEPSPESGLLNIAKPTGISSFGVVAQVRRILKVKRVGHCGTLDPLAEGVLLVLYGPATKLQSLCMGLSKTYRVRLRFGVVTDTGDITGEVRERREVAVFSRERIESVLSSFTGEIEQVPPMYSALKHKGQPLYKLARAGETVERAPRKVTIYRIEMLALAAETLELRVECSRGTYIRTLGEDIGTLLGCGATMEFLCREKVGPFGIETALDGKILSGCTKDKLLGLSYPPERIKEIAGSSPA